MLMTRPVTQASNPVAGQGLDKFVNVGVGIDWKHGLRSILPVGDISIIHTIPILTRCNDTNFARKVRHTLQR